MILYIYETNKDFEDKLLKNKNENIIIHNHNHDEIKGIVNLDEVAVEFIYRLSSQFLFLIADSKYEKRKAFNILYKLSSEELSYFKPDPFKEHKMICSSKDKVIKFIHDNKLINSNRLTKLYCQMELPDTYYLYESKITFEGEKNNHDFLYYGDAIKIKTHDEKYVNEVISFFEKELGE